MKISQKDTLYMENLFKELIDYAHQLKVRERRIILLVRGSMFSGKSFYLYSLYRLLREMNVSIQLYKSSACNRSNNHIVLHNGERVPAHGYERFSDIVPFIKEKNARVVAIDEAQFYGEEDIKSQILQDLAGNETHIVLAGLARDFRNRPFGGWNECEALTEARVIDLRANCDMDGCQDPIRTAKHSLRTVASDSLVLQGGAEKYMPICDVCAKKVGFFQER
jgi:thymidine kinase